MRRAFGRGVKGLAALLLLFMALVGLTARPGDPKLFPAGGEGIDIVLVSNGYHAGLALPRQALADLAGESGLAALMAVTTRFQHYSWLEIGWGDDAFYRSTPTTDSIPWGLAFQALAGLGDGTVLHVVGFQDTPERTFALSETVRIRLSPEGFARLAAAIDRSFASGDHRQPIVLGQGLYGPSLFFKATGRFHLLRVCNHWVADLLDAAGVPTTPGIALLPAGLITDLKWRSGLPSSRAR